MQQWTKVSSAIFSGTFPIIIDDSLFSKARGCYLDISVVRRATSPFFSDRTYPPTGFLASILELRDGLVIKRRDVAYDRVRIYLRLPYDDQLLIAMRCYDAINANRLAAIANALGISVVPTPNPFSVDLRTFGGLPNKLSIKCYADTALKADLYKLDYEECTPEITFPVSPPAGEPLPEPPPSVPTGTPVPPDIYTPKPVGVDDEEYVPFPGDSADSPNLTPPIGVSGERYDISFTWDFQDSSGALISVQNAVFPGRFAPITDYGIADDLTPFGSSSVGAYASHSSFNGTPANSIQGLGFPGGFRARNLRNVSIIKV